jgi:hypothetical protein
MSGGFIINYLVHSQSQFIMTKKTISKQKKSDAVKVLKMEPKSYLEQEFPDIGDADAFYKPIDFMLTSVFLDLMHLPTTKLTEELMSITIKMDHLASKLKKREKIIVSVETANARK